jgi:hypothetical protein
VVSTIKHFACNDQEDGKRGLDAQVSQRALREIYLRPFQIAARDADPGALMTSYNRVNGIPTSENKELLQGVLRDEWKWDPLIMSDCYAFPRGRLAIFRALVLTRIIHLQVRSIFLPTSSRSRPRSRNARPNQI